jgi:hypothetical protein
MRFAFVSFGFDSAGSQRSGFPPRSLKRAQNPENVSMATTPLHFAFRLVGQFVIGEEEIGFELFERLPRRVRITAQRHHHSVDISVQQI